MRRRLVCAWAIVAIAAVVGVVLHAGDVVAVDVIFLNRAPTSTPNPLFTATNTPGLPTSTPTITSTPTVTNTPANTYTPTQTPTATNTLPPTNTPHPPYICHNLQSGSQVACPSPLPGECEIVLDAFGNTGYGPCPGDAPDTPAPATPTLVPDTPLPCDINELCRATPTPANGSNCSAGFYARGVDEHGNAEGCAADSTSGLDYSSTLAGNPALGAGECVFASGANERGVVCEGATADGIEIALKFPDPSSSDKTLSLPNETGTLCSTGSVCSGYQAGPLSGDVVTSADVATIQPNSVALTTDTTGNYVTSISGSSTVTCTGCTAAEGGTPALSITADSVTATQVDETSPFVFSNLGDVTFQKETAADVTVAASTTSGAAGGALNLSAAAGASAGTAAGGAVAVGAGAGGASGGAGGAASLTAGNGTLVGGFGASGGSVNITSGNATVLGQTGAINITGGSGGSGTGGIAISTAASAGNSTQTGIAISTGNASGGTSSAAGNIALTAGTGTATGAGTGGGDVALTAGAGATNGNGGDVTLTAGASAGSGAAGVVAIAAGAGTGTDKDGGTSSVSAGASTGLGRALVRIMKYIASTATGSGANTAVEAIVVGGFKALTNNTVTTLANATLASNTSAGVMVKYSVEVIDGSNHVQNETGEVVCSVLNSNGTFLANGTNGCTKFGNQQGVTASGGGTLTVTWTMTAANPAVLKVNANSNLTPSTGYPRVNYELHNLTSQAVAVNQ